ncbi:MAG: hypothetical protein GKR89_33400 [Candidatus Latescibacteria bacterium]|nr:hypothetical protein [Candidatus Latescibacterota bacterium]
MTGALVGFFKAEGRTFFFPLALILAMAANPANADQGIRPVELGIRHGIEIHRGGSGPEHIGLQVWTPVGRFQGVVALDLLPQFPDDPIDAWNGRSWRAYSTVRERPFGKGWVPEIGYGLSANYAQAKNAGRSLKVSTFDITDTLVFAFTGPRWWVRPYVEFYLVNIIRHRGQTGLHMFFGLSALVSKGKG